MKKIFFTIIILLPFIAFSQRDLHWKDTTRLHVEKLRSIAFDEGGSADTSRLAAFTNKGFIVPSPYTYVKYEEFLDSIAAVRSAVGGGGSTNIYNSNGTIGGFRTVTGGDSSLTLTFNGRDSSGLIISSTATNAVSNKQRLVEVLLSGANSNSSQTTVGVYSENTHTGTNANNIGVYGVASGGGLQNVGIQGFSVVAGGTTNIGAFFSAGNATNNYGLIVNGGNSGFGQTSPTMKLQVQGRFGQYYANTGVTAANDLTLIDGNSFPVSGNTQINAIITANWQQGSIIYLFFSGTPVVKNNTAGGAGTATILLAGGADFNATANDVLTLLWNGTNWIEVCRSVN